MRLIGPSHRPQAGFSLIEFMIAGTLSLLVLAALTTAFVSNSRTRDEMERASQQIENGRYSAQVLNDDLELAGYLGQLDQYNPNVAGKNEYFGTITNPVTGTALPDPCATDLADLREAMGFHIQGIDNADAAGEAWQAIPSCIEDVKTGTDIVIVRRASTCVRGTTNCGDVADAPYFQASLCNSGTELGSSDANDKYALDTVIANLTKHQRNCTTLATMHRYLVHIYWIARNDVRCTTTTACAAAGITGKDCDDDADSNLDGDCIPTLKRAELVPKAGGGLTFAIASVAQGVEQLQMQYGIDYNGDGQPDVTTADPSDYAAPDATPNNDGETCADASVDCLPHWLNVAAVEVNMLVRATTPSKDFVDEKSYVLGKDKNGDPIPIAAANDAYKRHAFHSNIWLINAASRRQS
jgi:type IV pilus assembly protein PilW